MPPVKKSATYADIAGLPEHLTGEIVDGELFVSPRPRTAHTRTESHILGDLFGPFDSGHGGGPGGWCLLVEPELHLGEHVLVPDIAGWRRERLPELPDGPGISVAPDWICEVLSPSTAKFDRSKKLPAYGRHGTEWAWLVDPIARTIELFRWKDGGWWFAGMFTDDARVRIPPFDAIELDISRWWLPRPPGRAAEAPVAWTIAAITGP